MKLPENTFIASEKLFGYLLKYRPADDKSKFLALAGYTSKNWHELETDLREHILVEDAVEIEQTEYGIIYEINGNLQGPNGKVLSVTTIWMNETASGQTKFITLYPQKRKQK